jgi:phage-related protein
VAASPTLTVRITADAAQATAGIDDAVKALGKVDGAATDAAGGLAKTERAMRDVGDSAQTAARDSRRAADNIEDVGDRSGNVTSGLRDMSDAVAAIGFPGLAAGMQGAAIGFEAIDGAATLFKGSSALLAKAVGGLSKAMNILKISILTNPIFIIAAIIIAIGVAFVLLYTKCEGFRKVVDAVFKFVWNLIKGFWNWLVGVFNGLLAILRKPFDMWKIVLTSVFAWIKTLNPIAHFKAMVAKIGDVFSDVFDAIKKPFQDAMNWIKSHFKLPKINLPFVGGKSAPTVAGTGLYATARFPGMRATATAPIVINFNGPTDPHAAVRELRRLFRDDQARMGRTLTAAAI